MKHHKIQLSILLAAVLCVISLFLSANATSNLPIGANEPTLDPSAIPTIPPSPSPPDWLDNPSNDGQDLEGNAELVETKSFIFQNGEVDFYSVSTKQGNVFYVFIDKRLSQDGRQNVYFLNKVDDADLKKLIDPEGKNATVTPEPEDFATPAVSGVPKSSATPAEDQPKRKKKGMSTSNFLILGVTILGGGAVWFFLIRKPAKPKRREEEDEDNAVDGDEYVDE